MLLWACYHLVSTAVDFQSCDSVLVVLSVSEVNTSNYSVYACSCRWSLLSPFIPILMPFLPFLLLSSSHPFPYLSNVCSALSVFTVTIPRSGFISAFTTDGHSPARYLCSTALLFQQVVQHKTLKLSQVMHANNSVFYCVTYRTERGVQGTFSSCCRSSSVSWFRVWCWVSSVKSQLLLMSQHPNTLYWTNVS